MAQVDVNALIGLAMTELPSIITSLKDAFKKSNPNDPQPTDAQVIAAMLSAAASSIAIDENWKASHPAV